MKHIYLLCLFSVILIISCKKDNVEDNPPVKTLEPKQEQWGLVINYTSTSCMNCGYWGSPLLNNLANMGNGKIVAIAAHTSDDPMFSGLPYFKMSEDRQTGGGIPSFWIGDKKVYYQSTATSEMTNLLNSTPIAAIDMTSSKSTGAFSIKSKIKFFLKGQGDYYLGFYILESGINGNSSAGVYAQDGTSDSNYKHNYVLRKSSTDNFYGEKFATNPEANTVFDKELSLSYNASWTNQLFVAAVIWHYNPNGNPANFIPKYEFVNGFVCK